MIYIIMGVSGSGKSSLGMFLSEKLGWPFHEGDNYHPWENIQKMAHGEPLTDKEEIILSDLQLHKSQQVAGGSFTRADDVSRANILGSKYEFKAQRVEGTWWTSYIKLFCSLPFQDRLPWLLKLHEVIERERSSGSDAFMACSALKRQYRQILLYGSTALTTSSSGSLQDILPPTLPDVFFLYLYGDYDFIYQRMVARKGHYMRADLLRSQFDVLEPPLDEENALSLDIRRGITDMAGEVQKHIISQRPSSAVEP